jgi:hypothetical protein
MHEYLIETRGKGATLSSDDRSSVPIGRVFRPEYEGWTINVNKTSGIVVASLQFLENVLLVTKFAEVGSSGEYIPGAQAYEELKVAMNRIGALYDYSRKEFNMRVQLSDL